MPMRGIRPAIEAIVTRTPLQCQVAVPDEVRAQPGIGETTGGCAEYLASSGRLAGPAYEALIDADLIASPIGAQRLVSRCVDRARTRRESHSRCPTRAQIGIESESQPQPQ